MWQWLANDVTTLTKEILELAQSRPDKQEYMSLPRRGVSFNLCYKCIPTGSFAPSRTRHESPHAHS